MSWKKAVVFTIVLTFGPIGCNRSDDKYSPTPHDHTAQPVIHSNAETLPPASPDAPNPDMPPRGGNPALGTQGSSTPR